MYNSTNTHRKAPQSLDDFFYDPKICFVGATTLPDYYVKFTDNRDVGVKVGDLAARVLRRPEVTEFSLPDIAKEVGVSYQGEAATADVVVASEMVFSDEEIKDVLTDGYAYYQIGYNLLTSL
ncbi:Carbamoyl-phosphate synthase large chain [Bienertia sinuspersici]